MPPRKQPLTLGAPTAEALPCNDDAEGERLIRCEVGDMVKQLHELRRRLAGIESRVSQQAIESVIKACVELDGFLRSDGAQGTE